MSNRKRALTENVQDVPRQRMRMMWATGSFSDVDIRCGPRVWSLHRSVLAEASPVLECMFDAGMREANEGEVVLRDADPEIVASLLELLSLLTPGQHHS